MDASSRFTWFRTIFAKASDLQYCLTRARTFVVGVPPLWCQSDRHFQLQNIWFFRRRGPIL